MPGPLRRRAVLERGWPARRYSTELSRSILRDAPSVSGHADIDHGPVLGVHGRKQRGRPVAFIIARHRATTPFLPRRTGLGSVQRLDLTLFIERQHDGIFWRIQIEGHHIFQLLRKTGVVAQLEGLYPVWLQAVRPPDSLHGGRADTGDFRQTAPTPMGGIGRSVACGLADDLVNLGGQDHAWSAGARGVFLDPGDSMLDETAPPQRC